MIETKTGWWARQSGTTKFIIVAGSIAVVAGGIYLITKSSKKIPDNKTDDALPPSSGNASEKTQTTQTPSQAAGATAAASVQTVMKPLDPTLPNGGKGCDKVRTDYDMKYDYVLCDGKWYTKEKNGKNWIDISNKTVAVERLNKRYYPTI